MKLGVFLAIGESISDFRKKGQDSLLINNNFRNYSENFEIVYVFSYHNESLKLFNNVIILPNKYNIHRYLYSLLIPLFYIKEVINCDVFRGYQITGGIPGFFTKLLFKKKLIVNYGYPYAETAKIEGKNIIALLYIFIEKIIFNIADKIIITSLSSKEKLREYENKLLLIPNGVNTSVFRPIKKIKKKYDVLFVGRLEKQKNLELLINELSNFKQRIKLLLIGQGSQKKQIKRLCREKDISLNLIDKVSNSLLPNYYNQASIFVLPSLLEGNPKALIEAMSCGIPVVGNSIPGISEIIKNQKTGLLFQNKYELSIRIKYLLTNTLKAKQLGMKGREFIQRNYDFNKLKKKEINLLTKS